MLTLPTVQTIIPTMEFIIMDHESESETIVVFIVTKGNITLPVAMHERIYVISSIRLPNSAYDQQLISSYDGARKFQE